jgi:hypothetical protein
MKLSELDTSTPPVDSSPKRVKLSQLSQEPGVTEHFAAAGKSALEAVPGSVGAIGGAELGAGLGAMTGPFAPVAVPVGAIGGGIAGYMAGEKAGEGVGQLIPESVKKATGFTKEQREQEKAKMPLSSILGTTIPDITAIARGAYKAGKPVAEALTAPKTVGEVSDFQEIGKKIENALTNAKKSVIEPRRKEATQLYNAAKDTARQAQTAGQPFAESPQGLALARDLENSKYFTDSQGNKFLKSDTEIKAIDDVLSVLKPKVTGGQTSPLGKGMVSQRVTKKQPTVETQKDIDAFIDELRSIRDANKPGQPVTNYAGLTREYRKDLIDKIERHLYDWNRDYQKADQAYKAASQKLAPFETDLMRRILREEKFSPGEVARDTQTFAKEFFSSPDKVSELKAATGDDKFVAELGKDYVATVLSNKTPEQVKSWAFDKMNEAWMKEAGIQDAVQNYAKQASSVAKRKDILEKLGYAAIGGSAIGAIGTPLYYGIRRTLGL